MYSQVDLYDGEAVNIKTKDLARLEQILDKMSSILQHQGEVNSQTNIETLTLRAGMATAQLFMEEQIPMTETMSLFDCQVHPVRSLGYYGIGGSMLKLHL